MARSAPGTHRRPPPAPSRSGPISPRSQASPTFRASSHFHPCMYTARGTNRAASWRPVPRRCGVCIIDRERRTEMARIVISENVTLDGVIQDPAGDEGFRHGGWVGLIKDRPQLNKLALDEALDTSALLLGRRSYEWFAARWPSRSGDLADRLT